MKIKSTIFRLPGNDKFDYRPRYYDGRDQESKDATIRFKRGVNFTFSHSNLPGSLRNARIVNRQRQTRQQRYYKMGLLLAIFGVASGFILFDINAVLALGLILVLLVLFIRQMNKM